MRLSRTVEFHRGETLMSFAARLATVNAVRPSAFIRDIGLSTHAFSRRQERSTRRLAELTGVPEETLAESGFQVSLHGATYRGLKVSSRTLAKRRAKLCPFCIRADIEGAMSHHPVSAAWYRCAWLIPMCNLCPVHGCMLVETGPSRMGTHGNIQDLLARDPGWLDQACDQAHTGFDTSHAEWIHDQLEGKHSRVGFLRRLPTYAAARLCEVVGAITMFGDDVSWEGISDADMARAGAVGLHVADRKLREFVEGLFVRSDLPNSSPASPRQGTFMLWLTGKERNPDFAPVRDLVREIATELLPIGPGDFFLGPVTQRRWHSLRSAGLELSADPKRIKQLLVSNGTLSPDIGDDRTPHSIVFAAEALRPIAKQLEGLLLASQAQAHLGLTIGQWQRFRDARFFETVFSGDETIAPLYSPDTLDRFMASIRYEKGIGGNLIHLSLLNRRIQGLTNVAIVKMLQDGGLERVAIDHEREGFAGIMVDEDEVKAKVRARQRLQLSASEIARRLEIRPEVAVKLMENGTIASTIVRRRHDGSVCRESTLEALADFERTYTHAGKLVKALGVPSHLAIKAAADAGAVPVFRTVDVSMVIFRREDVETLLAA